MSVYLKMMRRLLYMDNKPKYQILKDIIIDAITQGELKIGEKLPSEIELQTKYEVSRHTVRVALDQLEHEGFIEKEHGVGSFVKLEKKERNKAIGVITTYMSDYIFPEIIRGIEQELTQSGYSMLLINTNNNPQTERKALQMMIDNNVEGIIVEPTKSSFYNQNIDLYLDIRKRGIALISINAKIEEIDLPYIVMDDVKAAYTNTMHLIDHHHKNIGAIFKSDDKQGKDRHKGFITALSDHGLRYENDNVIMYTTESRDTTLLGQVEKLLNQKRVTALVCYNDIIALEVLNLCVAQGIEVPKELSIVSFDNSILSMLSSVKITSISHPQIALGIDAAREIMNMIEKQDYEFKGIMYPVNLDIKESVKEI